MFHIHIIHGRDAETAGLVSEYNHIMTGNIFIVLEGIDGSGKSSISKELAIRLNAQYYRCPPRILMPIRKMADNSPHFIRYLYYLLGNFIAQREIRVLLKHRSVVCDWYIFSTIAYHSVL